ncbi:MAG TPA: helix-turn-helix transcriptional regulator [Sphaerochaeta sp.]|nr:helix-turn-helix transcriptional regulator [Sphaerochaeta sp.]
MTLGQVIKHLRYKKNMTQEQLIEKAKLTRSQLYYIEADRRGIHLTTLFAICNGLGVSLVEFVSYLDDPFTPSISSIEAPGATIG